MATLRPKRLRTLTVKGHPRGESHVSAASGLVCAHGRVYVMADDEHHLTVYRDARTPGRMHRVFPGDLPRGTKARKKRKPDVETLFLLPPSDGGGRDTLVALGSGSRKNRQTGVAVALSARGKVPRKIRRFDLRPIYESLRDLLGGELNIEGAIVTADELLLLNRAVKGKSFNAVASYRLRDLRRVLNGARRQVKPISVRRYQLGVIDGIALGFTDAATLPGGGFVFTAVAEDTDDSVADGACAGSVVGRVDRRGQLREMHRLQPRMKVEGIDLQVTRDGVDLCLVTDADTPARPSALLLARLQPLRAR
jgi:hypothetical protein